MGTKGDAAGKAIGSAGHRRGQRVRGVAPGTQDRPEESGAVGEAPRRGGLPRIGRVEGAGAGVDGTAGEALEAQALRAPPLRLHGVAGAVMMLFVLAIKMHVLAIPVFTCPFQP